MKNENALRLLNYRFIPKKDRVLESWRIMKEPAGPLEGDCEDYSLTLLWYLSDKSMLKFWWNQLTFRAVIWYTKTDGGTKHIMLKWRGQWVDNLNPAFSDTPIYKPRIPFFAPIVAFMMLLGKIWK